MRSEFAEVNGVRLHYVREGEGPLMMFLHGFPEFWYEWKQQLPEFGRDHLAVAPDMRGYNLSSKPAEVEQYRMRHLVADVRALAGHLGYARFSVVAHDWGGAVAWALAIAHPECLERLIIINAPHPGVFGRLLSEDPVQQRKSEYMVLFRNPEWESILAADNYRRLVDIVLTPLLRTGDVTEEDRRAYIQAWSQPGALTGGLNYYRAARIGPHEGGNFALDPAKLKVEVPTLVIWGENDVALVSANVDGLPEFVPDLTVRRVPGASHWIVHERSDQVNAWIRDFAIVKG